MKRLCAFLLAAALCLGQSMKTISNPKASPIRDVCLAPTEARLMRVGMKGGETLTKESEEWASKLRLAFRHALTDAGGRITDDLARIEAPSAETRESVVRIRRKFDNMWPLLRKKAGGVKKGRYTLGDEISLLPCAREADTVAFVEGQGLLQTGGRKTLSILMGGLTGPLNAMARYQVWISFLDTRTGDVKTHLSIYALGGKAGKDPDAALSARLTEELKRAHIGASPPVPKQARR